MANGTRKEMILDILKNYSRFMSVEQLSKQLYVSGATIRRDLQDLEKSKLIQRTHGGVMLLDSNSNEPPMFMRENRNGIQKQFIANIARKYIKDGMTLFLDSSSTISSLARRIDQFSNLRIITTNLKVVELLAGKKGITVMCTGGTLKESSMSFGGQVAVEFVRRLNADAAFLSAQGFHVENGAFESTEEEYWIKKAFLANSRYKYLLCDTSKLNVEYLYRISSLGDYDDVITEDRELNARIAALYRGKTAKR